MTQETRDALDVAAHREHRSASEIAETWLTRASRGEAEYRERIGGSQVGEAIEALLEFAKTIEEEVGDPRTHLPARDALLAGWRLLIDRALPYTPNTPEGRRYHVAATNLKMLCRSLMEAIEAANDDEGEDVLRFGWASSYDLAADRASARNVFAQPEDLYQLLRRVRDNPTRVWASHLLTRLEQAAPPEALKVIVDELKEVVPPYLEAFDAYMGPRMEALKKGELLAQAWTPPPVLTR